MAALRPVAASACCKAAAPAIAAMSAKRGGRLPSRPACSRLSSPLGNAAVARPACWQRRQWRGGAAAAGSRGPPPGESEPPTPGGPYDAAADAKPTAKSSAGPPQEPLELQPLFPADQCTPAGATPQQRAQRTSPSPRRRQPSGAAAGDGSGRRLASEEQVVALLQEAVVGPIRADVAAVAAACGRLEEAQQVHAAALAEAQELLRTLEGRAAVAASAVAAVAADSTAPATDIDPQPAPGEATGSKASPVQPPAGEQQQCEQTPPPTAEVSPVPSGSAARADSSSGRGSSGGSTRRGALLSAAVAVGAAAGVAAYNLQLGSVPAPPPASLPATQQDARSGALDRSGARGGGGDGADGAAMNGGSSATAGRSSTDPLRSQGSTPNYCKRLVTLREPVNNKEVSLLELLDAPVAQPGAVKQLLMLGNVDANICTEDRKGIPALALALRWDHVELVELMLEAGATACAADLDGYTLMHYARSGAAVRLLVRQGAFVNAKAENWMTPLHVAAREGWVDAAQALLDAGADVSSRTLLEQRTPLHVAAVNGQFQIVRQLLAAGAAVDAAASRRETALHRAAAAGHTAVCRLLLTAGADPAVKNTSELTPADVAPTSKLRNLLRPRT